MYLTAYNPTNSPLTADGAGRQIGGGEWGTVDTTADGVRLDLLRVFRDGVPEGKDVDKAATDAAARTQEISDRASQLQELDRNGLGDLARTNGMLADDAELPTKAELISLLAGETSITPPSDADADADDTPSEQPAKTRRSAANKEA